MKKITRKDFAGLRQHYPVLSQEEMRQYVGGLNAEGYWENSDSLFTAVNPYATDFGVAPFSSSSYGYGDRDVDGGELPEVVIRGYYDGGYDAYEGYDIDGGELPEVVIGGSYPDDNENWNPEWDYYDPWPDEPDFDSTTGNDGYYDMGYWYEEYDGDNGNTGGSSGGGGTVPTEPSNEQHKYSEEWERTKDTYYNITKSWGIDLSKVNIELGMIGTGYAGSNGKTIIIGYNFFQELSNNNDRATVLVHEYLHLKYDNHYDTATINTEASGKVVTNIDEAPDFVKQYADMMLDKEKLPIPISRELLYVDYITYDLLRPPVAYENELNVYQKEIELCPDSILSEEYVLERKYKLWKYELLLEKSKEVFSE